MISIPAFQPKRQPDTIEGPKNLARLAKIGEFSASIIHEARNPLTTVLLGLRSLHNSDIGDLNQQRLELALGEAERLQRLLDQVLQYSKSQPLNLALIELNDFFTQLFHSQLFIHQTLNRNIQFVPTSSPVYVNGDIDKLKQVFINLIINAGQASPPDEPVTCRMTIRHEQHQVCLDVHNWGDPIPAKILPKLTQPFFTTKADGTGLGLSITQKIIDDHKGQLQISSTETSGTVIKVILPTTPFVNR